MTAVSVLDPRHDPEPSGWREFCRDRQLHPVWDYELMRVEGWLARNPTLLALVRTDDRIVAAFALLACAPTRGTRFAPAGTAATLRRGVRWIEVYQPWLSGYPGCVFAPDLDAAGRKEIVRLVERELRTRCGAGFLGMLYRNADAELLDAIGGRARIARGSGAVAVLPISWGDHADWLATLGRNRRGDLRRRARVVAADTDLVVRGGAGRTDIDPYQASTLLNEHRRRHGRIALDTRSAVGTEFLAAFLPDPRVHTLTYRDSSGRLLAMCTLLDHPHSPVLQHWAALPLSEGGRKHLYFDAQFRAVCWAVDNGRAEITSGRGLLEVKASLGFRPRQLSSVLALRPALGRS